MTTTQQLKVNPLPGVTFGAVFTGIDLQNLYDQTWKQVKTAFYEHGLAVFPGQHLDADSLPVFAQRFGSLMSGGTTGARRAHSITNEDKEENRMFSDRDPVWLTRNYPTKYWHTDGTFNHVMPMVCLLSGASVASKGGQTAFADLAAAYDALDQPTKDRIADLRAYHSNLIGSTRVLPPETQEYFRSLVGDEPVDGSYGLRYSEECPLRPLVRTHSVTCRRSLFLGRHTFGIPGKSLEEADRLLRELEETACQPPRVYLHDWRVGDLVVFDNRRLLHRACDYDEEAETRELLNCRVSRNDASDQGLGTEAARQSGERQAAELVRLHNRDASEYPGLP